jgi:GH24 family phage-related lysozyme (muramidase)
MYAKSTDNIVYQAVERFIKKWNEPSFLPYINHSGYEAIGYNHIIKKGEEHLKKGLTPIMAEKLLREDIERAIQVVDETIPMEIELGIDAFIALVSLAFCITPDLFRYSKVTEFTRVKRYDKAAKFFINHNMSRMEHGYVESYPLTKLRKEEAELYKRGMNGNY